MSYLLMRFNRLKADIMIDEITQVDIAINGDFIFTGYLHGEKKHWEFTQEDILFFIEMRELSEERQQSAK